jgi:hypothetical protein
LATSAGVAVGGGAVRLAAEPGGGGAGGVAVGDAARRLAAEPVGCGAVRLAAELSGVAVRLAAELAGAAVRLAAELAGAAVRLAAAARWPARVVVAGAATLLTGLARLGVLAAPGWAVSPAVLGELWAGAETGAASGAAGLPAARGPVASVVRSTSRAGT